MQNKIFALTTLVASTVTLGQELPNPNPAPQADGTQIWYVGNNTQYPVIQDVLAACSDGDEIVVNGETGTANTDAGANTDTGTGTSIDKWH